MGFHFPDLRELLAPPLPGRRFTDSKAFAKFVAAAFNKVAVAGVVDDFALVVAMCELHFKVRRRMPGVTRVPTRDAVREVLAKFDTNRDGVLDEGEFTRFAKQVRGGERGGGGAPRACGRPAARAGWGAANEGQRGLGGDLTVAQSLTS
eukprot:TRINITY_DN689_c0_g2_i3.p2 TRINITY_DN689_c0_g2~~TRINITY_DN689_c0_g2_i3.p2  ORF type:complete len:149 (+),score=48.13 TRINITY_DN689_c0_g2_i3:278-724(+)